MSTKGYRPDSTPPTLGDLRQLYRRMNELDERLAQMQAQLHVVAARVGKEQVNIGQMLHNLNTLVEILADLPDPAAMKCRAPRD